MTLFASGGVYPTCDDPAARAALTALYDNQRLSHAIDVSGSRLLSDGLTGRHCSAIVRWDNGLKNEVPYSLNRESKSNQYVSMWIDYNGGMRGPRILIAGR